MRVFIFFTLAMFLVAGVLLLLKRGASISPVMANASGFRHPDIEYFKVINSVAPPQDPQILFLLMGQYSNANLQKEGAEFFSARLKEFGPRLTDAQKSLYLSAIGLLRAQTCTLGLTPAPNGLCERHDRDIGTSTEAFGRTDLRCELDRGHRLYRACLNSSASRRRRRTN